MVSFFMINELILKCRLPLLKQDLCNPDDEVTVCNYTHLLFIFEWPVIHNTNLLN